MAISHRWTSSDLKRIPDDGKRREIIDGELYVSTQPHHNHQDVWLRLSSLLQAWSDSTGSGRTIASPGVIFANDNDVAPDIAWTSIHRFAEIVRPDGHLYGPPELVVEVLSPGSSNERRDREKKLNLYSRRGVDEYWIVNWRVRTIEIFRRGGATLTKVATLAGSDSLTSPLLPGFETTVDRIFVGVIELPEDSPGQ